MALTPSGIGNVLGSIFPFFRGQNSSGEIERLAQEFTNNQDQRLNEVSSQLESITSSQLGNVGAADWRARLRPKDGGKSLFWTGDETSVQTGPPQPGNTTPIDYLLEPLHNTNGLVWQYTPSVMMMGRADYNVSDFQGQNYPVVTYKNTAAQPITVTGDFTANTVAEARYLLGVMHFLKVSVKSFSGDASVANGRFGTPPPVLLFEYMGDHGFNKVPVVVTEYNFILPPEVDYVPVITRVDRGETTYVPTSVTISLTLQPSHAPHKLRKNFDLGAFTSGASYKGGYL